MDPGQCPQPDTEDNDNGGRKKVHLQCNRKIIPEGFTHRPRSHKGPAQVALGYFFHPSEILDVKGIIQAELLDDSGNIFGLLGRSDVGGGSALRAEGHKDAEKQHRYPEQHQCQQQKATRNIGEHNGQVEPVESARMNRGWKPFPLKLVFTEITLA